MKKVLFLLAVGAMFSFAACNSQPKEEPQPVEEAVVEETVVEQAPEATDTANVATDATQTPEAEKK